MIKKYVVVGLVVGLTTLSPVTKANEVNDALQNICKIVKNDDKALLRKKVGSVKKEFLLRFDKYYEDISCGGMSLLEYADKSESLDSLKFMVSKLKVSTLKDANYIDSLSSKAKAIIQARID